MTDDPTMADTLRRTFDASFARPIVLPMRAHERLLTLEIDGVAYAISLREIAGVAPCGRITRLPTSTAALLGLAGIVGRPTPVFDLGELLGHARAVSTPPWVVLARAPYVLAFATASTGNVIEVAPEQFAPVSGRTHTARLATLERRTWSVVSIPSLLDSLRRFHPDGATTGDNTP